MKQNLQFSIGYWQIFCLKGNTMWFVYQVKEMLLACWGNYLSGKEKVMEGVFYQQPYVEHIRKKYLLFTVCIMDIERKVTPLCINFNPTLPFYHNDNVKYGETSYTIDLKI
jgi:hypothetical protein